MVGWLRPKREKYHRCGPKFFPLPCPVGIFTEHLPVGKLDEGAALTILDEGAKKVGVPTWRNAMYKMQPFCTRCSFFSKWEHRFLFFQYRQRSPFIKRVSISSSKIFTELLQLKMQPFCSRCSFFSKWEKPISFFEYRQRKTDFLVSSPHPNHHRTSCVRRSTSEVHAPFTPGDCCALCCEPMCALLRAQAARA